VNSQPSTLNRFRLLEASDGAGDILLREGARLLLDKAGFEGYRVWNRSPSTTRVDALTLHLERYSFKTSPHGSHSTILRLLPRDGALRRVLDLGCGPGHLSVRLAECGFDVLAVDLVKPVETHPGVRFVSADLNALDRLPVDGQFDYILVADVLEHLLEPERVLAWVRDRLAPGGRAVFCVPNFAHAYVRLKLLLGNFDREPRGILDSTHIHFYTRRSLVRMIRGCGLAVCRVKTTAPPLELMVPPLLQGRMLRVLDGASALAARVWPGLLAYQFVCETERERPAESIGRGEHPR